MSWKATAHVKGLERGTNGVKITRAEKLVLFVIADYYNEDMGCAWASRATIARESLTSERHLVRVTQEMQKKGLLGVETRNGNSNLYTFPGLLAKEAATSAPLQQELRGIVPSLPVQGSLGGDMVSPLGVTQLCQGGVTQLCQGGGDTAMSPEPIKNYQLTASRSRPRRKRVDEAIRRGASNQAVVDSYKR